MTTDPRLERYLITLEKALMSFPVSDRADIITEIKSHVLSALERDPEARLDAILSSLGEPETVANRYLLERGLKPTKTSIHPVVKWLTIGFLGAFAMLLIFCGFLVSHFGSAIKVDGKHVQVLGGLIDVDGTKGQLSIGSDEGTAFAGEAKIGAGDDVAIIFSNGKFEFTTTDESKLAWACTASGNTFGGAKSEGKLTILDFNTFKGTKCKIGLPKNIHVSVSGDNGKASFDAPKYDIDMKLGNGKVVITPDSNEHYKFELSTDVGKVDGFKSSTEADAHAIKVHIENGKISNGN